MKNSNERKVMVFGTFDFFHQGHKNFFKQARKHGSYLIVVIAKDETVESVKKKKPFHSEKVRKKVVEESELTDLVVLGKLGDKFEVLEKYQPEVVCLGYDQTAFVKNLRRELNKRGLRETEIVKLFPYKEHIYKSSKIFQKLKF